jgi:hypothetical protein
VNLPHWRHQADALAAVVRDAAPRVMSESHLLALRPHALMHVLAVGLGMVSSLTTHVICGFQEIDDLLVCPQRDALSGLKKGFFYRRVL